MNWVMLVKCKGVKRKEKRKDEDKDREEKKVRVEGLSLTRRRRNRKIGTSVDVAGKWESGWPQRSSS